MPSPPAVATYLFGLSALLLGVLSLLRPALLPTFSSLPFLCQAACAPAARANAVTAIAMGVYYPLLAYQENHAFFAASVIVRCMSAAVFWQGGDGWRGVGVWEGIGAAATGGLLGWEWWRGDRGGKGKVA